MEGWLDQEEACVYATHAERPAGTRFLQSGKKQKESELCELQKRLLFWGMALKIHVKIMCHKSSSPMKIVALHQESGFRIRIDLMRIRIRIQHFFYLQIPIQTRNQASFEN